MTLPAGELNEIGASRIVEAARHASEILLREEPDDALEKLLDELTAAVGAEAGSILLVDKSSHELFFAVATGLKGEVVEKLRIDELSGVAGHALQLSQPVVVNNTRDASYFEPSVDAKSGWQTRNIVACPLIHGDVTFGVMEILNKEGGDEFTSGDRDACVLFANMAALAIWQSRRYARCFSDLALDLAETGSGAPMIGRSSAIQELKEIVPRIAKSDAPILITGESGVGKEVLAKLIWKSSGRARRDFSAINCAAIPATLIESELFGHEKGSFTGAHQRRVGRFEAADKGTLFLDEIGDLPLDMQSKLLRALQEMEITRIGSTKPIKVDVRIIAATNRDLKEAVRQKQFREDLFYRLNVLNCRIPPLRERAEDIEPLAKYFIAQLNESMGRAVQGMSSELTEKLKRYAWPGNIRELRNVIERLMVLCDGNELNDELLPPNFE